MANFKENVSKVLDSKPVQVISSGLLTLGTSASYLSFTKYRHMMPRSIGEHATNFGLALPIITIGATSVFIEDFARQTNNKKLEQFAKKLYPYAISLMVIANTVFESQFLSQPILFKENTVDFAMGIMGIILGMLAVRGMRKNIISDII